MQADSPIFPGAKLEKLMGGFEFTEGPAADTAWHSHSALSKYRLSAKIFGMKDY